MIYTHVAAALIAAFIAATGTWRVQEWRHGEKEAKMEQQAAEATTVAVKAAKEESERLQAKKDKALNEANERAKTNAAAAAAVRSSISGLRDELAAARANLSKATREAAIDYAKTCRAVLQDLAEEGGQVSEKADGHASDAATLDEAWPK